MAERVINQSIRTTQVRIQVGERPDKMAEQMRMLAGAVTSSAVTVGAERTERQRRHHGVDQDCAGTGNGCAAAECSARRRMRTASIDRRMSTNVCNAACVYVTVVQCTTGVVGGRYRLGGE